MLFSHRKPMSRLKKKLLIYFLLVAIVSISVSTEIILELSSSRFTNQIESNIFSQIEKVIGKDSTSAVMSRLNQTEFFAPLNDLRDRMILLLLVVSACIIGSFFMFAKDIVSPMDGMVEATKRISEGDLTITVPVKSQDEIGQIGELINNMNTNLQDMIMQIRQEIKRHMDQIIKASYRIREILNEKVTGEILQKKRMRLSDFKKLQQFGMEVAHMLETMSDELNALQKFVSMYKTYQVQQEITQEEIEKAMMELTNSKEHGDSDEH